MKKRRLAVRAGLAFLVLLAGDAAASRWLLSDGTLLGRRVAPFDPPLFSPAQFRARERVRGQLAGTVADSGRFDRELGWCNPPDSGRDEFRYDGAGARVAHAPGPRIKRPDVRRVVAVGCSMTHGEEVGALETWCAQIDELRPDLEVINLGVAAYGIDQALLRLRRDGTPLQPDEVWLGILPQAALRVTTRFRPLVDHWSLDVAFKPAFRLDSTGALEVLPNPAHTLDDVDRLLGDQQAFLSAFAGFDPWVDAARAAYSPRGSDWRHHLFSARLVLTWLEAGGRDVRAAYRSEGSVGRLFRELVLATGSAAADMGAVFRVLVLPGKDDLVERTSKGRGYWEDWATGLRSSGVPVFDATRVMIESGIPFERLFAPHGHYTAEGNRLVAEGLSIELPPAR